MEERLISTIDTLWLLIMGLLVFFMNCGFAMLETGFCRVKNAVNMLSKNLVVIFISISAFWFLGFAVMFSNHFSPDILKNLFLLGSKDSYYPLSSYKVPVEAIFFFQAAFACITATIVSGAVAERIKFIAFLIFAFFLSSLIYPVVGNSILGKGILYQLGVRDFAGSLMVHTVGGIAALSGVLLLGPRVGKYNKDLSPNAILGHSMPLITLGGFILWLGWFGFNLGCTFGFSPELSSHIVLCTNACGIMGGLSALIVSYFLLKKADLSMVINGLLGGLVSSTAVCAYVNLFSAHLIGLISGYLVVTSIIFFDRMFHIDDPVGTISVHVVGGIWGAIALGLFASPVQFKYANLSYPKPGLLFGGGYEQLQCQLIGLTAVILFTFLTSTLIWIILKHTCGLRISQKAEVDGLDIAEHGMEAYPGFVGSGEGII